MVLKAFKFICKSVFKWAIMNEFSYLLKKEKKKNFEINSTSFLQGRTCHLISMTWNLLVNSSKLFFFFIANMKSHSH